MCTIFISTRRKRKSKKYNVRVSVYNILYRNGAFYQQTYDVYISM